MSNGIYLIKGLNDLAASLEKSGRPASEVLMRQIERRLISGLIAAKVKPTADLLEAKFKQECDRFGAPVLFYRDQAAQHADLLVKRAETELESGSRAIQMISEQELDTNLVSLRSVSKSANAVISRMAKVIQTTRHALEDAGSGATSMSVMAVKNFKKALDKDDVVKFASEIANSMDASHDLGKSLGKVAFA